MNQQKKISFVSKKERNDHIKQIIINRKKNMKKNTKVTEKGKEKSSKKVSSINMPPSMENNKEFIPLKKYEDMTPEERISEMSRMRLATLDLADRLYKTATDDKLVKTVHPNKRLNAFRSRYPNFARLYPVVLAYLVQGPLYSRKCFEKILKKIEVNPGSGIEGFNERQADYAKYLYIEMEKKQTGHYDNKKAKQIWVDTYDELNSEVKKIRKIEEEKKSEFEAEGKKHLLEKRAELRDFILKQKALRDANDKTS